MQQSDGYCSSFMPITDSTAQSQQVVQVLTAFR
jgi:hypothetical protein